jgi:HSP20 family protein
MNLKSLIPVSRERNAVGYHPFASIHRELDRMLEDFGRGFPAFGTASQALMPATDVVETDKEIEITAELPGLEEKDVKIELSDNTLTIRGEKKAEKEEKDKNYRMIERSYGAFARSLELPAGVDAGAIKATIANGVLKVTVQKPAPAQARTIEVKPAK